MNNGLRFCPIHEYEYTECNADCRKLRPEFKKIVSAFNSLWYSRRHGVGYVPLAPSRCIHCHKLYQRNKSTQRYCTTKCRKASKMQRYRDSKHFVTSVTDTYRTRIAS